MKYRVITAAETERVESSGCLRWEGRLIRLHAPQVELRVKDSAGSAVRQPRCKQSGHLPANHRLPASGPDTDPQCPPSAGKQDACLCEDFACRVLLTSRVRQFGVPLSRYGARDLGRPPRPPSSHRRLVLIRTDILSVWRFIRRPRRHQSLCHCLKLLFWA